MVLPQTVLRVVYNGGQGIAQTVLGVAHRGGGSLWHLGLLDSRSDGEQTNELSSSQGREESEEEEGLKGAMGCIWYLSRGFWQPHHLDYLSLDQILITSMLCQKENPRQPSI